MHTLSNSNKSPEKETAAVYRRAIMDFQNIGYADRLQFFGTANVFEAVGNMSEGEFVATVRDCEKSNIIGITLLPKFDYYSLSHNIPALDEPWWLKPAESCSNMCAIADGRSYVSDAADVFAVRPALIAKAYNFTVGHEVDYGGKRWTYIGDNYFLCNTAFCKMAFRKDENATDANDYESSDIKAYLDNWFRDAKNVVMGGQIWESSYTGERVMVCVPCDYDGNVICCDEDGAIHTFSKAEFNEEFRFSGKIVQSFGGTISSFCAAKEEFGQRVEEIVKSSFSDNHA